MNSKKTNILSNSIFFTVYKVLNVLFPLITASYVARVLLSTGVGKVSYAQNITTYFTFLATLGLPVYGTREIAKVRDNRSNSDKLFSELFSINFWSTTICVVIYYVMISTFSMYRTDYWLYVVTGLAIILNYGNVDWFYQGREEYKYISIRSIFVKLFSTLAVFLIVHEKSDYIQYALIHCFVLAGNNILNIIGLRKRVQLKLKGLEIKRHIRPLMVLFASNIAIELYTLFDTTMLGVLCEDNIVGYYSYAMKISKILVTVLAAAFSVLLPKLSQYQHQGSTTQYSNLVSKAVSALLLITLPCAVGLCLVSPQVIPIMFGKDFIPAIPTLRILSILAIPISLSTFMGAVVLTSLGKEKKMLIAVCAGAVSNLAMNALMIPAFQQNGAAIASVISELLVAVLDIYFVTRVVNISLKVKDVAIIIGAIACMVLSVLFVQWIIGNTFVKLVLSIVVGGTVYFIVNWFLCNSVIKSTLDAIVKKIRKN